MCRGRALTMRTGSDRRAESIALDCKRLRAVGSRARILCQVALKATHLSSDSRVVIVKMLCVELVLKDIQKNERPSPVSARTYQARFVSSQPHTLLSLVLVNTKPFAHETQEPCDHTPT